MHSGCEKGEIGAEDEKTDFVKTQNGKLQFGNSHTGQTQVFFHININANKINAPSLQGSVVGE